MRQELEQGFEFFSKPEEPWTLVGQPHSDIALEAQFLRKDLEFQRKDAAATVIQKAWDQMSNSLVDARLAQEEEITPSAPVSSKKRSKGHKKKLERARAAAD